MDSLQQPRRAEKMASAIFNWFSSLKNLIGLVTIALLSVISITFNYQLGELMGTDSVTHKLFPVGFAALDLAALFLAGWLTVKSKSFFRRTFAWCWLWFLVSLSVWAAMSFTLASDAKLQQAGLEKIKAAKIEALEQANQRVAQAQKLYENPGIYKMRRARELDAATAARDDILTNIQALNEETPPPGMAIYHHTSALLVKFGYYITPETLAGLVRMLWALALTLSVFVLVPLVSIELASKPDEKKREPVKPPQRDFAGENSAESKKGWGKNVLKFGRKTEKTAQTKQIPISDGKQVKITACERSIQKVVSWLATQHGRVNRGQIKSKCANRDYDNVSAVIKEIEKRGYIKRNSNGHTIVNRAKFDKEGAA